MGSRVRDTRELTYQTERRWGPKASWRCVYCGRIATTVDHFWPLDHPLGSDTRDNLVPACRTCNSEKMEHDPWTWMAAVGVPERRQDALRTLITRPGFKPRPVPEIRFKLDYEAGRALKRQIRAVSG